MPSALLQTACFHCGLPVPDSLNITVKIDGKAEPMCCHGCEAVAQAIINSGMDDFYRFRTSKPARPEEIVPAFVDQLKAYDNPKIQQQFVTEDGDIREVALIIEGIVCAACVWLNEQHLNSLPGVISASINYSNNRARVRWNNDQISLSDILEAISRIGYMAHPYDPDQQQRIIESERKQQIRRLGVAGVLGMQIMILAVAMYSGEWWGMEPEFMQSFRWISLVITVPILLFASRPFFTAALRDLGNRRVGMDVPVALGIAIAFIGSVVSTVKGSGAVYYDSVAMFTFFLLTARYFEMGARKKTAEATESLLRLQPAIATLLINENGEDIQKSVPVAELKVNDRVLIRPGENIPADGTLLDGSSGINESLMTGESLPIRRSVGEQLIAGSTNTENPLIMRVDKVGDDTVLASIHRLLDDAQQSKPAIARLADQIASKFVAVILILASAVAIYWYRVDPEQWIAITIATLVVTCPCALSLATPTATTAASGRLAKLGLLPTNGHALETLAKVTDFVFDKTGTLTRGEIRLVDTIILDDSFDQHPLAIAAALENTSEHPVAHGIIYAANEAGINNLLATNTINTTGGGISADINNQRWHIGNLSFINELCKTSLDENIIKQHALEQLTLVALATEDHIYALFTLDDSLREEAASLVAKLKAENKNISLMTGDNSATAQRIAKLTGIQNVYAHLKPADKLARVREMQKQGAIVAMTGDGINDAPVLAGADVSIAMGSGTQLAAAHADMILLSNHIEHLYSGYKIAKQTLLIIRQNLTWAFGYNLIAIPAAATGHVDPWLAAIGMSLSSLLVVINALRLTRIKF